MNGKRARLLRRVAKQVEATFQGVGIAELPRTAYTVANPAKPVTGTAYGNNAIVPTVQPPGTFKLKDGCVRSQYQRLKRQHKRARAS